MKRGTVCAAALLITAAGVRAQSCDGSGAVLTVPDTVAIGELVTAQMHADPPVTEIMLFASLGDGPFDGGTYGTLCLDFPPIFSLRFVLDANGDASFTDEVPCDPAFIGQSFYLQFITCSPGKGKSSHGSSNMEEVTIVDGIGSDSFCTWTQADFDLECAKGGVAHCLLFENFDRVFPGGVTIGDPDGDDDDDCYAARWTTPSRIENYLEQPTRCVLLQGDRLNPTRESGFRFGAELLVAKLNVGFDDAGVFDEAKCRTDRRIGDLVFVGCVSEHLIGWSVRDLIDLADLAICGALGPGPFDLDGDGKAELTCDDLMQALAAFNANFRACEVNEGCLEFAGA